jgi:hypothetical protein
MMGPLAGLSLARSGCVGGGEDVQKDVKGLLNVSQDWRIGAEKIVTG